MNERGEEFPELEAVFERMQRAGWMMLVTRKRDGLINMKPTSKGRQRFAQVKRIGRELSREGGKMSAKEWLALIGTVMSARPERRP